MLFHPKTWKVKIITHDLIFYCTNIKSIVCATVDSQCLEYLGCITLAPGCHPPQEKWKVRATRYFERDFHKSGHPDKLAQPFEKNSERLLRACTKTEKWRKTTWPVCSLHQLEKLPYCGVTDVTDCDSKSLVTGCLFWQLFSNVWKRQSGWVGISKCLLYINSPKLNMRFIDSSIQQSVVLYLRYRTLFPYKSGSRPSFLRRIQRSRI